MSFSLFPAFQFERFSDIRPEFLRKNGIKLLLLDLDNTLSPYGVNTPGEALRKWIDELKAAGITPFIVSNSKKPRPDNFASALGISVIKGAMKPSPRGPRAAMEQVGASRSETALVGDQIYTDTLAANLAGVSGILVQPIRFTNPFLAIRWFFELPFRRAKGKKRG